MVVYSKKSTIRFEDKKNPTRELQLFLNTESFKGIDCIILKQKSFQNELDIELVCSDVNPTTPKTEEDIDRLLTRLHVVKDKIKDHPNDPLKANNHLLEIMTNLDNPNISDSLRSKAKLVHDEEISKEQVRSINEEFDSKNKKLSETSTDNSSRLKALDERKKSYSVGEIERA
jgi:hypothetical protein